MGKSPPAAVPSDPARFGRWDVFTLTVVLGLFAVLVGFVPLSTAVQIGVDEGFELAKAMLSAKGYRLYSEVWNDQPPLHTFVLTRLLEAFGSNPLWPRLVSVLSAMGLVGAGFFIVRRFHGTAVATVVAVLMVGSPAFLELACSAMLEVPALSFVVMALAVLVTGRGPLKTGRLIGAGLLFAVALQIKFIGLMYAPLLVGAVLWLRLEGAGKESAIARLWSERKRLSLGVGVFASAFLLGGLALGFAVDRGAYFAHLGQPWSSHFGATKTLAYGSPSDHPFDGWALLRNWDVTVPALMGLGVLLRQRKTGWMPVVAWLGLTLVVFGVHRPWWSYYYVHHAIPLAWCAAVGMAVVWRWAKQANRMWLLPTGFAALVVIGWMGARVWLQVSSIRESPQTFASPVIGVMERFQTEAKTIYSDEPVWSFHARLPLPPKLGVLPLKRFWAGEISNERIVEELERVRPELILLRNDSREVPFSRLLQSDYRVVYHDELHRLYALKPVANRVL